MGRHVNLDLSSARYDRLRDAIIVLSGSLEVAICHDALEAYASRSLTQEEGLEFLEDQRVPFSRMANSLSPDEGTITITSHTVNKRVWDVLPAAETGEDS